MSRTAQAISARIELLNATTGAHTTAHVMTSAAGILGDINLHLLFIGLGMATGCAGSSSPAAVLAAYTVCHAGSVPRMAGTLCTVAVDGRRLLRPPEGRLLHACSACARGRGALLGLRGAIKVARPPRGPHS